MNSDVDYLVMGTSRAVNLLPSTFKAVFRHLGVANILENEEECDD